MKLFTSYTYTWWQIAIFKLALLSIGVIIGTYTHQYVLPYILPLAVIALLSTVYIWSVSLGQLMKK